MAIHHPDADRGRADHRRDRRVRLRRDRDAPLELAAAAPLRVSRDHAAAGIRSPGAVPDVVWRLRRRWRREPSIETHDARGARAVAGPVLQYARTGSGGYGDRQLELDTEEPGVGMGSG